LAALGRLFQFLGVTHDSRLSEGRLPGPYGADA
jgi:hypothetical protein